MEAADHVTEQVAEQGRESHLKRNLMLVAFYVLILSVIAVGYA